MNFSARRAVAGGDAGAGDDADARRRCEIIASDNREALIRLSTDPLTIQRTRVDALGGLVDLMDAALAAAPRLRAPALFLYGGHDELVPKEATAATWRALPRGGAAGPRIAYYPDGYHLLLRDLDRARADRRHRGLGARPGGAAAVGRGAGGGGVAGGAGVETLALPGVLRYGGGGWTRSSVG